jgi:hypothetical protein
MGVNHQRMICRLHCSSFTPCLPTLSNPLHPHIILVFGCLMWPAGAGAAGPLPPPSFSLLPSEHVARTTHAMGKDDSNEVSHDEPTTVAPPPHSTDQPPCPSLPCVDTPSSSTLSMDGGSDGVVLSSIASRPTHQILGWRDA